MFRLADRVVRNTAIGGQGEGWKRGSIVEIYESKRGHTGHHDTLYAVLWDGETEPQRGYLEVGLKLEPLTSGLMVNQ